MSGWLDAKNILAARLDNIGDVVMLGPALRAVKEASPDARLTLLASPAGAQAATLLPWIDDVIEWRTIWQDVGGRMAFDRGRERELIEILAEREFDAALIFTSFSQNPHVPGYVCYLAGVPLRAGESKEFGGSALTDELRDTPHSLHQAERSLRLVESLGFPVHDRRLAVELSIGDRRAARDLLTMAGVRVDQPLALLHPGASASSRRYPASRYAEVARSLLSSGWQVLVTGVEREAAAVHEAVRDAPGAVVMLGNTTLAQYAAMIEVATVVVCGNTLPMHLADALEIPVVALFAGTDLESQWRPRFTRHTILRRETVCHPCYLFDCPIGQPCLDIPASEVVATIEALCAERVVTDRARLEATGD
jgi:ADP-heptose:LPS heptosyltransferase